MTRTHFRRLRSAMRAAIREDRAGQTRFDSDQLLADLKSPFGYGRPHFAAFRALLTPEQSLALTLTMGKPSTASGRLHIHSPAIDAFIDGDRHRLSLAKRVAVRRAAKQMEALAA